MSKLTEIQKAIEELAPEEKDELRDWLDGFDTATEREWAAVAQERIRQIESGEVVPLDGEQVLKEMRQLAKQLAQQPSQSIMRLPCAIIDCNQGIGPKAGAQPSPNPRSRNRLLHDCRGPCRPAFRFREQPALGNRRSSAFTNGRGRCCAFLLIERLLERDPKKQSASGQGGEASRVVK
jgi:hypothetical protein